MRDSIADYVLHHPRPWRALLCRLVGHRAPPSDAPSSQGLFWDDVTGTGFAECFRQCERCFVVLERLPNRPITRDEYESVKARATKGRRRWP